MIDKEKMIKMVVTNLTTTEPEGEEASLPVEEKANLLTRKMEIQFGNIARILIL